MMKLNALARVVALPAVAAAGAALLGACGTPPSAGPPPAPTTCYVRATGNNAILEVTGVDAGRTCRDFQAWSLKQDANRILEVVEAKPDPTTLVVPGLATDEVRQNPESLVKQTCSYTLDGTTYTVTDTGLQSIGGGWCKHFYSRSVEAQVRADARAPRS